MSDSVTRIERVKRAARLCEFWKGKGTGTAVVVRYHATTCKAMPDDRMVNFIATTEAIDVDDEVVIASGVKPDSYFFANKACFIDHQYDMDHFVGSARRIIPRPTDSNVKAWEVNIRLRKDHPATPAILDMAADGLIGSSIGFARLAGGKPTADEAKAYSRNGRTPLTITRSWEWIEQSITAMPANVEARSLGFEEAKSALLDELLTKGRIDRTLAVSLGLPESPRRKLYPVEDPEPKRRLVRFVVDKAQDALA